MCSSGFPSSAVHDNSSAIAVAATISVKGGDQEPGLCQAKLLTPPTMLSNSKMLLTRMAARDMKRTRREW
jgi:hypothetical protein